MVISKCEWCGKEKEYQYKSLIKKYCSHKCANEASAEKRTKQKKELICEKCGKSFYILESVIKVRAKNSGYPKYCSRECMGEASRTGDIVECKNCGKEFYTTRNICCSVKCRTEYIKNSGILKKSGSWYENGYKVLYLDGNKSIKEHVKIVEDNIGRKLIKGENVHHINEILDDNRIENLKLMTRGEHSRLHRNKELKQGKILFKKI